MKEKLGFENILGSLIDRRKDLQTRALELDIALRSTNRELRSVQQEIDTMLRPRDMGIERTGTAWDLELREKPPSPFSPRGIIRNFRSKLSNR